MLIAVLVFQIGPTSSMAGLSSRWIIVLCFCFLLQQFAPAYTAHLSGNTLVMKSKRADEEEQEQEQEESQEYHHDQDEGKWT